MGANCCHNPDQVGSVNPQEVGRIKKSGIKKKSKD